MPLPTDYDARKAIPIYDFLVGYFPDAFLEVVKVAVEGNKQHNLGEPLHWARGKSMDQMNTALRHMMDDATSDLDTDGCYHLAKAAWRNLAALQLKIEARAQADRNVMLQKSLDAVVGPGTPTKLSYEESFAKTTSPEYRNGINRNVPVSRSGFVTLFVDGMAYEVPDGDAANAYAMRVHTIGGDQIGMWMVKPGRLQLNTTINLGI